LVVMREAARMADRTTDSESTGSHSKRQATNVVNYLVPKREYAVMTP
jgi:hypothetical protein